MAEKKSLLLLRKEANELGIQNYAKYSRDELEKLIEQKKAGITTVTDEAMIASDEDVANEQQMVEEHAKTVAEGAEDPDPEVAKKEKAAAKEAKKAEKAAKKERAAKEPKEKKPRAPKVVLNVKPKGEKPEGLSEISSKIYDELLKNDGRSFYQIAKACSTYYTVVKHVCDKHFEAVEK
jgi:FtsZ-interacting cell division protein ZipA